MCKLQYRIAIEIGGVELFNTNLGVSEPNSPKLMINNIDLENVVASFEKCILLSDFPKLTFGE